MGTCHLSSYLGISNLACENPTSSLISSFPSLDPVAPDPNSTYRFWMPSIAIFQKMPFAQLCKWPTPTTWQLLARWMIDRFPRRCWCLCWDSDDEVRQLLVEGQAGDLSSMATRGRSCLPLRRRLPGIGQAEEWVPFTLWCRGGQLCGAFLANGSGQFPVFLFSSWGYTHTSNSVLLGPFRPFGPSAPSAFFPSCAFWIHQGHCEHHRRSI